MKGTPGGRPCVSDQHQVIVMIGEPDPMLVAGLRKLGFSASAGDDGVVVWSRRLPVGAPGLPPAEVAGSPPAEAGRTGLLMTVVEAAAALGIGRSTVYELIGQGQLEAVHIGRSTRIPVEAVRRLVEDLRDHTRRGLAS